MSGRRTPGRGSDGADWAHSLAEPSSPRHPGSATAAVAMGATPSKQNAETASASTAATPRAPIDRSARRTIMVILLDSPVTLPDSRPKSTLGVPPGCRSRTAVGQRSPNQAARSRQGNRRWARLRAEAGLDVIRVRPEAAEDRRPGAGPQKVSTRPPGSPRGPGRRARHRAPPSVSRIPAMTTTPDSSVRAATTWIAIAMPSQSATRPARSAPTA